MMSLGWCWEHGGQLDLLGRWALWGIEMHKFPVPMLARKITGMLPILSINYPWPFVSFANGKRHPHVQPKDDLQFGQYAYGSEDRYITICSNFPSYSGVSTPTIPWAK